MGSFASFINPHFYSGLIIVLFDDKLSSLSRASWPTLEKLIRFYSAMGYEIHIIPDKSSPILHSVPFSQLWNSLCVFSGVISS